MARGGTGGPESHLAHDWRVPLCLSLSSRLCLSFLNPSLKFSASFQRGYCSLHRLLLSTYCVQDPFTDKPHGNLPEG